MPSPHFDVKPTLESIAEAINGLYAVHQERFDAIKENFATVYLRLDALDKKTQNGNERVKEIDERIEVHTAKCHLLKDDIKTAEFEWKHALAKWGPMILQSAIVLMAAAAAWYAAHK